MADVFRQAPIRSLRGCDAVESRAPDAVAIALNPPLRRHLPPQTSQVADTFDDYKHSATCSLHHLYGAKRVRGAEGHRYEPGHGPARRQAARRWPESPTSSRGGGSTPIGALGDVTGGARVHWRRPTTARLAIDQLASARWQCRHAGGAPARRARPRQNVRRSRVGIHRRARGEGTTGRSCGSGSLAREMARGSRLGAPGSARREDVIANCDPAGLGDESANAGMIEAVTMVARLEGVLLDPGSTLERGCGLID